MPRRRGRLRRRARRLRRRWSASAATSAWSATTTSRCWASSTSRPSPRPRRPRSSGRASSVSEPRRSSSSRGLRAGRRARGHRPLPRLAARPGLGVRALDRAGRSRARRQRRADRPDRPLPRRPLLHPPRRAPAAADTQRRPGERRRRCSTSASGEWLLNPGSVGQPRDGDPRAAWLELDTEAWTARFHRVPYDVDAAPPRRSSRPACPSRLAERLAVGADAQMQGKYGSRTRSLDSNHGPLERTTARLRPRSRSPRWARPPAAASDDANLLPGDTAQRDHRQPRPGAAARRRRRMRRRRRRGAARSAPRSKRSAASTRS